MNVRPTILFCTGTLNGGGIGVAARNLMNALARRGYNVSAVLGEVPAPSRQPADTVAVHLYTATQTIAAIPFFVRLIKARKPDVIYTAHEHVYMPVMLALWLSGRRRETRIVHWVHTHLPSEFAHAGLKKKLALRLFRRFIRLADAVIAPSDGTVWDDMTAPQVIPNIVHASPLNSPNTLRACTIVTAGRLVPQKNMALLVQAFAELPADAVDKLLILGDGPERDTLLLQVSALGLSDRVNFLGQVDDVSPYLGNACAVVVSSDWEGFGMVAAEALSLGTPVISTDCPVGPAEMFAIAAGGFLVPRGNAEALAHMMRHVLETRPKVDASAYRRAYSEDVIAPQHEALISALLGQ